MNLASVCVLLCVLFLRHDAMCRQFPLNINYTYRFIKRENNNNSVDLSNPLKFKFMNTKQIIEQWGYQGEEHNVTTEDGYIISIYRIRPKRELSPPVLLLHGLLACSEIFVVRGPDEDLAFLLSEAGYDVWLGNFRGNYNGKRHVNLTTDDENFWKFSFHESGIYDLPAFIDYILERTGFEKLTMVGHSYSNAVTMVMASERPEYNEKLNLYVAMAPYVFASHLRYGGLAELLLIPLKRYCYRVRKFEILERRDVNPLVRICDTFPYLCVFFTSLFVGASNATNKVELTPMVGAYYPSGTNLFTLMHITNIYSRGRFCQLDLGKTQNQLRYNSDEPPDYDLSRVTVPVQIYSGSVDRVVDVRDVARLAKSLPNLLEFRLIPYNHIEFLSAGDTKEVFYNHMINLIGKYSQQTADVKYTSRKPPR